MATPTYHIVPCTPLDIPSMINTYSSAFSTSHLSTYTFPPSIPQTTKNAWLHTHFLRTFSQPNIRNFKIVDSRAGQMVAWARWGYPHVFSEEEKFEKEMMRVEVEEEGKWPAGANLEVCEMKFGGLEGMRRKWVGEGEDCYIVYLICTNPVFQRRGLARMLLQHGIDLADREGRKVYLEATREGHPVYLKMGFRDVDVLKVDLNKWGGGEGVSRIMIRD